MSSRRQTTLAQPTTGVPQRTFVVDANGVPLGRLAAQVAQVLMGKHRPDYTPHVDTGEYVIVTNATKVELTGSKAQQRFRRRYSQYPGGVTLESYGQLRQDKPDVLVSDAVRRMLPKNRLSRMMLKKLRVFPGTEHGMEKANPIKMTVL